ncbi:MAG: GNAT family N-acetyltransferase [Muribaculaceae bacterium]|nr:GNAT family N-acetyltransferase [Muribaculaceae bacterium]
MTTIEKRVNEDVIITKEQIKDMWRESFSPREEWLDMYFNNVYKPEEAITMIASDDDEIIASSLLLQRYMYYFHQMPIPVGYISGATTRSEYRDRGYMSELMRDAMNIAYDRGDVLMTLIPADRSLYFYYDKLGFGTIFYVDEARYTAMHHFEYSGKYRMINAEDNHEVFRAVDSMLRNQDNVMLHSYGDFQNILRDVTMDGGRSIVMVDDNTSEIVAFALAVPGENSLTVRELLYTGLDARNAALETLRRIYVEQPITVLLRPGERNIPIHARGMGRIINVKKLLETYASRYPEIKQTIKVYDAILPQNSHIYVIDRGEVIINDGFGGKIDIDVTQEVLLSILSSDKPIGEIFNLPTARPYISMMMD